MPVPLVVFGVGAAQVVLRMIALIFQQKEPNIAGVAKWLEMGVKRIPALVKAYGEDPEDWPWEELMSRTTEELDAEVELEMLNPLEEDDTRIE